MISNYSGFKGQRKTTAPFVGILGPMGIRVRREERQMFLRSLALSPWIKTMRLAVEKKRSAATIVPWREILCAKLDSDKRGLCEVNCSVDTVAKVKLK